MLVTITKAFLTNIFLNLFDPDKNFPENYASLLYRPPFVNINNMQSNALSTTTYINIYMLNRLQAPLASVLPIHGPWGLASCRHHKLSLVCRSMRVIYFFLRYITVTSYHFCVSNVSDFCGIHFIHHDSKQSKPINILSIRTYIIYM